MSESEGTSSEPREPPVEPPPPTAAAPVAPRAPLDESPVVRSIYVYGVCAVALVLIVVGSLTAAVSAFRVVAPAAGHRDNIDRIGIGLADVAEGVIDRLNEEQRANAPTLEEFCGDDDSDECEDFYNDVVLGSGLLPEAVTDVVGDLRGELESQIRWTALGRLVAGIGSVVAGWLLFSRHRRLTALYRL